MDNELKISAYEADMDKLVLCANCKKPFKFGDMYTSTVHFTKSGFGYAVCKHCYEYEIERRKL